MRTHAHTHGCTGAQALVAERHQIDPSLLSTARWRKPETMTAIHGEAGRDWRNALKEMKPGQGRYPKLDQELHRLYKDKRKRGLKVTERWLCTTARKEIKKLYPGKAFAMTFKSSHNYRRRWAKRFKVVPRKKTNKKQHSVESRLPVLKEWHSNFHQLLGSPASRTKKRKTDPAEFVDAIERSPKWGRFLPSERYNVDQSPLPFAVQLDKTFEDLGASEVWISQPGSGLEKRQATLQCCFRCPDTPDGDVDSEGNVLEVPRPQPRPAIIFRGQGFVPKAEKAAHHPGIDVYWQKCAWADRKFCVEWALRTWKKYTQQNSRDFQRLMTVDNLDGQLQPTFRNALQDECSTLPWYGPKDRTDLWQPVDQGYAAAVKVEVDIEQQAWLEDDDNLEKWEGSNPDNKLSAGDRRILMSEWVAVATARVNLRQKALWRYFERGGNGMSLDGSEDSRITPAGRKDYTFPRLPISSKTAAELTEQYSTAAASSNGDGNGDVDPFSVQSSHSTVRVPHGGGNSEPDAPPSSEDEDDGPEDPFDSESGEEEEEHRNTANTSGDGKFIAPTGWVSRSAVPPAAAMNGLQEELKALQRMNQRRRQKTCLSSPKVARLFEDRVTLVKSWHIGRFRRYYATGRLQDHYEIKFDDGDLADLPLPPEDYGDANMEDGWVLIDEAEI